MLLPVLRAIGRNAAVAGHEAAPVPPVNPPLGKTERTVRSRPNGPGSRPVTPGTAPVRPVALNRGAVEIPMAVVKAGAVEVIPIVAAAPTADVSRRNGPNRGMMKSGR